MNSYSKVVYAFISSIIGFTFISPTSIALNSNFNQDNPNNVQNSINPAYLCDLLSSACYTLEYVNNIVMLFDVQDIVNNLFDSS